jgi:hypothetical protein
MREDPRTSIIPATSIYLLFLSILYGYISSYLTIGCWAAHVYSDYSTQSEIASVENYNDTSSYHDHHLHYHLVDVNNTVNINGPPINVDVDNNVAISISDNRRILFPPLMEEEGEDSEHNRPIEISDSNETQHIKVSVNSYIDILFLVTNRARCENVGLAYNCTLEATSKKRMVDKLDKVIREVNKAFYSSNIAVRVRRINVTYWLLPSNDLYPNTTAALTQMERDQKAIEWRNTNGADLLAMITGHVPGVPCGIARQNSFTTATSYICLDQKFGFAQQLGHNLGCYKNRANSTTQHPYAHGYQYKNELRTIMSEECTPQTCTMVPYFSSPDITLSRKRTIGTSDNDCARMINERAPYIENYRDTTIVRSPLTCDPKDYEYIPRNPWFLVPSCNGKNIVHFVKIFGLICTNSCITQKHIQFFMNVLHYKCGPCQRRFFNPEP